MLIIGLGNIGQKYENTRHNIGFMVIDYLIKNIQNTTINKSAFKGELFKAPDFFLLKPHTFMNLSGESAIAVKNFYKINEVIVIHDDIDLEFGAIKFKLGGSSGGHNGLKSLDSNIGNNYIRVRIGVGKPEYRSEVVSFVLNQFNEIEQKHLPELIKKSAEATIELLNKPLNLIASKYSQKRIKKIDEKNCINNTEC